MFRYIIRPQGIITTPRRLKELFNARRTLVYPFHGRRRANRSRDLFLAYPPIETLEDHHALNEILKTGYTCVRNFYISNKPIQRNKLAELGFNTSKTFTARTGSPEPDFLRQLYIARPFRHSSGRGYRLLRFRPSTETSEGVQIELLDSWNPATEYLQELYPKTSEYRVIIARGQPIITLVKRHPGISPLLPWNHAHGSSFVTVTDMSNNRLRHTNVYSVIEEHREFFKHIDLCALDILVNLQHEPNYVVSEINFCPSISIPDNLERVRNAY